MCCPLSLAPRSIFFFLLRCSQAAQHTHNLPLKNVFFLSFLQRISFFPAKLNTTNKKESLHTLTFFLSNYLAILLSILASHRMHVHTDKHIHKFGKQQQQLENWLRLHGQPAIAARETASSFLMAFVAGL